MSVTSYSVAYYIYIPGKPGFCFNCYYAAYDECKNRTRFGLQIVVVCVVVSKFIHYTISLSSLCKLIWRHWTYKMPARYLLSSVWVRLSIYSHLSIIQFMGLCDFSLPISLVMIERIHMLCLIIIIKSELRNIIHCFGLGHETMVCAVWLSTFLSIMQIKFTIYF